MKLPEKEQILRIKPLNGDNYVISEPLKNAIELALIMQRPLLITGNPGVGKSDLAEHLVKSLEGIVNRKLLRFNVKTTSNAADLLYRYDAMSHYHASRTAKEDEPICTKQILKRFITFEALGEAILDAYGFDKKKQNYSNSPTTRVVLIDEIDKAPRDLPNDLLDVLDNMRFEIPELRAEGENDLSHFGHFNDDDPKTEIKPFVIMTSNSDKSLPEPFLRRCIFYHIPDPEGKLLIDILKKRLPNLNRIEGIDDFIAHFNSLSKKLSAKTPAVAELIQWLLYCNSKNITADELQKFDTEKSKTDKHIKDKIWSSYSLLIKDKEDWLELHDFYFPKEK